MKNMVKDFGISIVLATKYKRIIKTTKYAKALVYFLNPKIHI